ncbi:BPI fold-containing family B member 1 [Perognathus longimembris pacificus]|uniref:BPI fold-containing family B member 1 n=1 Tax=Perognathus longimembris pacificus TaxID=214514 RepID=UPI0020187C46|nr:BPI fold-containing family B member 1 [Perognathus longimembris pacificus]
MTWRPGQDEQRAGVRSPGQTWAPDRRRRLQSVCAPCGSGGSAGGHSCPREAHSKQVLAPIGVLWPVHYQLIRTAVVPNTGSTTCHQLLTNTQKMTSLWVFACLSAFVGANLAPATPTPPAVFTLGPEVINSMLTQELKEHDATALLHQLPLLSAIRQKTTGGIPLITSLFGSILRHIIWLRVTSANILQLQVQAAVKDQELVVRVPLDMVAGFNTPLVKTIVELHMETEAQAFIGVESSPSGPDRLVLRDCLSSQGSLRVSLLNKLSFLVNSLADNVINLLVPALPQMVKEKLCPVIQAAFDGMYADVLKLVKEPIFLSPGLLKFDLLSPAIKGSSIQLNLQAKLLDSKAQVTKWFNDSDTSLALPTQHRAPVSLIIRQNVVSDMVAAIISPEELVILLDFVLPELARELKMSIEAINKTAANKLGPTQIVKIVMSDNPQLFLSQAGAKMAQLIKLEVFATNKDVRPFFTLGIEASSEIQFYAEDDRLMLNFNDISFERIRLMISDISLFNPDVLKSVLTKILRDTLLPNENGKLRHGIPMSVLKALGYNVASWSVAQGALVLTPASV